jgi:hypothetical protein
MYTLTCVAFGCITQFCSFIAGVHKGKNQGTNYIQACRKCVEVDDATRNGGGLVGASMPTCPTHRANLCHRRSGCPNDSALVIAEKAFWRRELECEEESATALFPEQIELCRQELLGRRTLAAFEVWVSNNSFKRAQAPSPFVYIGCID